jgi:hypothetical protein
MGELVSFEVAYPRARTYIVYRKSFPKRVLSWHQTGGRSLNDKNCSAPKAEFISSLGHAPQEN